MDQGLGRACVLLFAMFATAAVAQNCSMLTDCGACTSYSGDTCYFCKEDNTCNPFTATTIFKFNTESCPKLKYFVGQCTVPTYGFAIIIASGLLLVLLCCVCTCCCLCCFIRRCSNNRSYKMWQGEQVRYQEEKAEIKDRHAKKKADKKVQYDEIRQKWGTGDEYHRM